MDDSHPPVGRKCGGGKVTSFESPATVVAVYPVQHRNQLAFVQRLCSSKSHIINIKASVESRILLCSCWCLITKRHRVTWTARLLGRSFWGGSGLPTSWEFFHRSWTSVFLPKTEFQSIPLYSVFNRIYRPIPWFHPRSNTTVINMLANISFTGCKFTTA